LDQADSPDLDIASEVEGLVAKLREEQVSRRRTELSRLVEAGSATPEQRAEFGRLLASLSSAKSGNPPTEERSDL
jgi:hypothetical protein